MKKNRELFDFSGPRGEERVNEKDSNCKTPLRVKSKEEVFEIVQAHEILSESDCSETEENKTEFVIVFEKKFEFKIYISLISWCNLFSTPSFDFKLHTFGFNI